MAAAADPIGLKSSLERVAANHPDLFERMEATPSLAAALVSLAAASPALVDICARNRGALDSLEDLEIPFDHAVLPAASERAESLAARSELGLLRIAARDLCGLSRLEEVGGSLAQLATEVTQEAFASAKVAGCMAVGMGKLGGKELNYSSDIDLMIVGLPAEEPALKRALQAVRGCFKVDLGLRPEGNAGALVRSVDSYASYWERWAEPWEFQALLKARPIAGDPELARQFSAAAGVALWSKRWGSEEIRQLRKLKERSEAATGRRGLSQREVKRGLGGIRDVEFAVQLLQLVHGGNDPSLRDPNTLSALSALAEGGYVSWADAASLSGGYRFLRATEHRLQLVQLNQTHLLPSDPPGLDRLARSLGFCEDERVAAVDRFEAEMRRRRTEIRSVHERLWFRPLLDAFARGSTFGTGESLSTEAASERLAAAGFGDIERIRVAVDELTRGLSRYSGLMRQMLPLLLSWLADSPDAELGLAGLRNLSALPHSRERLGELLRESPRAAKRLCLLLGTSSVFAKTLRANPDLIEVAGDQALVSPRDRHEIIQAATDSARLKGGKASATLLLRNLVEREISLVAARDVLGESSLAQTESSLTALTEAVLELALEALPPPRPLAVVAMGRFGGGGLSYASDVDLVLVTRGDGSGRSEAHALELLRMLNGETPVAKLLTVDTSLRPEGRDGPLVRSIDAFARYFERWASTWERQAYLRARPVAGDVELGREMEALISGFVFASALSDTELREIRRIKARLERERVPPGEDAQFHLKLGRGSLWDVEWTVQLAQLQTGVRGQNTLAAIEELSQRGVFGGEEANALADSYRFCTAVRNRLYLTAGRAISSLPTKPEELARLAASLGTTRTELREDYRRVTRRARAVMDRHFWAMNDA